MTDIRTQIRASRTGVRSGVALFLVAFIIRATFVVAQLEYAIFDISFEAADSRLYRHLAESIVTNGSFAFEGTPTAFVTPGYSLFLAALSGISNSTVFIALVQAGLGALTVVLLAAIARELGGTRAGLATGVIAAVYPHLIFWTGYVLTETLYVFVLALALWGTARALESRRLGYAMAAGAMFGLAGLVRPLATGFGIVIGVMGLLIARHRMRAAIALAGLFIVLAPWVIRNAVVLESPVITSTEAGFVLWQGNSPNATGGSRGYVDNLDFDPLEIPASTTEVESDRIYRDAATTWMIDNPGRVTYLVPVKLWNMWRPTYEGASRVNTAITYATYLPLLGLSVPGLFLLWRRGTLGRIVVAFVLYHLVAHGLVTGMIRFRLPVEGILTIPAGLMVASLIQRIREPG